jgi:hypothetical protein
MRLIFKFIYELRVITRTILSYNTILYKKALISLKFIIFTSYLLLKTIKILIISLIFKIFQSKKTSCSKKNFTF